MPGKKLGLFHAGKRRLRAESVASVKIKHSLFWLLIRMEILHLTRQGSEHPSLTLKFSLHQAGEWTSDLPA